jgi:hypothetical protein
MMPKRLQITRPVFTNSPFLYPVSPGRSWINNPWRHALCFFYKIKYLWSPAVFRKEGSDNKSGKEKNWKCGKILDIFIPSQPVPLGWSVPVRDIALLILE